MADAHEVQPGDDVTGAAVRSFATGVAVDGQGVFVFLQFDVDQSRNPAGMPDNVRLVLTFEQFVDLVASQNETIRDLRNIATKGHL